MENKLFNYSNILRGKHSYYQIINELKVLSFLAILAKRKKLNTQDIDFTEHNKMNDCILKLSNNNNGNLSTLLKDIIVNGVINCCLELNSVYKDLLSLNEKELLKFNSMLYQDVDNKYLKEAGNRSSEQNIVNLVYKMCENLETEKVLDLCSGEGNFLYNFAKEKPNLRYVGYEINPVAILLSKLRLELLNVNYCIKEENVLSIEMNEQFDLVFSEYPWGVRPNDQIVSEKNGYVEYYNSKSKADWAFINKAINSLKENGKAIVLSSGAALFGLPDRQSREQVVNKKLLESIITLPSGILPWTSVNSYLLIFSHDNDKVKFIDASHCFEQKNKVKSLDVNDVLKLMNTVEDTEYIKHVANDIIERNDFNLNVSNYIGDSDVELINPHKLEEVADVITGFQYTTKTVEELPKGEGNITVLKGTNISTGEIDLNNTISINIDEKKVSKYLLRQNDILISTKGTTINSVIVPDLKGQKVIPNNILTIIRIRSDKINAIYLYSFLNSETGKKIIKKLQNGAFIMNVTRKSLLNMEIPVLDIDTQETIANKYLLLTEQLKDAKKRIENLTNKINNIYEDEVSE